MSAVAKVSCVRSDERPVTPKQDEICSWARTCRTQLTLLRGDNRGVPRCGCFEAFVAHLCVAVAKWIDLPSHRGRDIERL